MNANEPVRVTNGEELYDHFAARGIGYAHEVTHEDGGVDSKIHFVDGDGNRHEFVFARDSISRDEINELISQMTNLVYRGTAASTEDGYTSHIYDVG